MNVTVSLGTKSNTTGCLAGCLSVVGIIRAWSRVYPIKAKIIYSVSWVISDAYSGICRSCDWSGNSITCTVLVSVGGNSKCRGA